MTTVALFIYSYFVNIVVLAVSPGHQSLCKSTGSLIILLVKSLVKIISKFICYLFNLFFGRFSIFFYKFRTLKFNIERKLFRMGMAGFMSEPGAVVEFRQNTHLFVIQFKIENIDIFLNALFGLRLWNWDCAQLNLQYTISAKLT